MFLIKEFEEDRLNKFFEIFQEIGIIEIEADWAAQNDFEEFNFYCWRRLDYPDGAFSSEEVEITDELIKNEEHVLFVKSNSNSGLFGYLDDFLKSCIPFNYKENFGSFGFIKFKILEKDYEIVKFEYSEILN